MRSIVLLILLFACSVSVAQNLISFHAREGADPQERRDPERDQPPKPADEKTVHEAIELLRRSVNGKAAVRNECLSEGRQVQLQESTEVVEIDGCKVTFKSIKTTTFSPDVRQEVEFTLHANLSELTTPASVEPQSFAKCKPVDAALLRVKSRAQPGKVINVGRRGMSSAGAKSDSETQMTRNDLSFFFPDAVSARKSAELLEQAVKVCGGTEWQDEDDLP